MNSGSLDKALVRAFQEGNHLLPAELVQGAAAVATYDHFEQMLSISELQRRYEHILPRECYRTQ